MRMILFYILGGDWFSQGNKYIDEIIALSNVIHPPYAMLMHGIMRMRNSGSA